MFPKNEERQVRTRFSQAFKWVVSQRLVPKLGGGRMAGGVSGAPNLAVGAMVCFGLFAAISISVMLATPFRLGI